MSIRKKYTVSVALLVFLLAATTVSPAFMEKPDPLGGGGGWPKAVCALYCWDGDFCYYAQWTLSKNGTFVDSEATFGTWNLSSGVFTITYDGGSPIYSGPVTGRAVAGIISHPAPTGAFSGVYSPAGCNGIILPEPGFPSLDGSQ